MAWDSYELWLTDDSGARISDERGHSLITRVLWMEYSRMTNGIGWLSMGLPVDFDTRLLRVDRMVQVWRAPRGHRLTLVRPYFIRKWRFETQGARETLVVSGPDMNDLARRRIVAYYEGDPEAELVAEIADDGMKDVVDENYVNDTSSPEAGTRDLADLTVQYDLTGGPAVGAEFGWRNVLRVLQELQRVTREYGTEVFWDFAVSAVSNESIRVEFRTKTGQPGQDLTPLGVLFDQRKGNMGDAFLEFDYSEEVNYVYGVSQGEQTNVVLYEVYDENRYEASRWNRCEGVVRTTGEARSTAAEDAAYGALEAGRPRRRFGADATDVEGMRFGADWNWGDKVRARYRGHEFDCIVRAVTVSVNGAGAETVRARLEWEETYGTRAEQ